MRYDQQARFVLLFFTCFVCYFAFENSVQSKSLVGSAIQVQEKPMDQQNNVTEEIDLEKQVELDQQNNVTEEIDLEKQVELDQQNNVTEEVDQEKQVELTISLVEDIREHFPECLATVEFFLDKKIDFPPNRTLKYVRSNHTPRYDHLSCPVMKPRYNCAGFPPKVKNKEVATDYKLVSMDHNEQQQCDFRALVDAMDGPAGVAKSYLLEQAGQQQQERNLEEKPLEVLLQGNSYLRQIWEALVCGYSHQITDMKLLRNGPGMKMADVEARGGALIPIEDLGETIESKEEIDDVWRGGCHAEAPIGQYFWPGEIVPPSTPGCSDDVAMVEFGSLIRFYYIFHPSQFTEEARQEIYHHRLSIGSSVDIMLWNDEESVTTPTLSAKHKISIDSLLPTLKKTQQQSLHRIFGANNPWVTNPPDNHPCMPGIPDDEVNVILSLLLLNRIL